MNTSNKVICYDYEYRKPCEKSMYYSADEYYRVFEMVSRNWYKYLSESNKNCSILDIVKMKYPKIPRIVLSDIVNSISLSMSI